MGTTTEITWTDHTWNPWQGCHKVSEACANCYMYRDKARYGQDASTVVRSQPATFRGPLKWKEPARVFTCSWSDFFIEEADEWRADAWEIIRRTPHLTYQVLTKRIERTHKCLPSDWPLPNVWLGVTVEIQGRADERIPVLLDTLAVKRFVSCEPLLGPLEISRYIGWFGIQPGLDWVIVGGETGSHSRMMKPDWARSLRDQCQVAGVPFFFKQWGKQAPGCLLDGKQHHEFPI